MMTSESKRKKNPVRDPFVAYYMECPSCEGYGGLDTIMDGHPVNLGCWQCERRGYIRDESKSHSIAADPRVKALVEALHKVQWEWAHDEHSDYHECFWCEQTRVRGHADDCERQLALAPFESPTAGLPGDEDE